MFGQLKIVPSADIGQLGPHEGETAGFNWKWYYSAARWIIWLALILAFVAPKANHNIQALWVLVPLGIVNILWCFFMESAHMNSTDALQFGIIFHSMAVAVAVLWLIMHYFKGFGGVIRFLLSFTTVVIIAGLGTLAYSTEISTEMAFFLILFTLMTFTMLIAITLSRRFCGETYRPICFLLLLVPSILLVGLVTSSAFFLIGYIIFSSGPNSVLEILIFICFGLFFGLFLYMLNLPFLILGFVHPFFRERFCACLRLKPVPVASKQAGINLLNEKNPGKEIPEKGDSV